LPQSQPSPHCPNLANARAQSKAVLTRC
jgi:hypothetical protein